MPFVYLVLVGDGMSRDQTFVYVHYLELDKSSVLMFVSLNLCQLLCKDRNESVLYVLFYTLSLCV